MDNERPALPKIDKDPFKEIPVKDFSYINSSTGKDLKPKKRWPMTLAVIIVLLAIGTGIAYFVAFKHPTKTPSSSSQSAGSSQSSDTISAGSSTNYTSTNFNLSVNYPKAWIVSDNSSTLMTITSSVVGFIDGNQKLVSGKIVISVQPQGQVPPAIGTTGSVAVLASQLINYSNPTANQRASTFVSFVQYPTTTVLGGLDAIYITGDNGYQKGQDVPGSDMSGLNPLVGATFEQCLSPQCTSLKPLTLASSEWDNSSFKTTILNIFKSFSFS